jgi:hypothetical protein
VEWDGNHIRKISTPYDKEVQSFSAVSDCTGDYVEVAGKTFLLFQFPGAGRTLCCNMTDPEQYTWTEWGQWNSSSMTYNVFLGRTFCFCPAWGVWLVGSRRDSKIYTLSPDFFDDAGEDIRFSVLTGHIDHGISRPKRCREIRIRAKRGAADVASADLQLRYRDLNSHIWSNEMHLPLGKQGETNMLLRVRQLGIYHARQWELVVADPVPVSLVYGEMDVEVLDR